MLHNGRYYRVHPFRFAFGGAVQRAAEMEFCGLRGQMALAKTVSEDASIQELIEESASPLRFLSEAEESAEGEVAKPHTTYHTTRNTTGELHPLQSCDALSVREDGYAFSTQTYHPNDRWVPVTAQGRFSSSSGPTKFSIVRLQGEEASCLIRNKMCCFSWGTALHPTILRLLLTSTSRSHAGVPMAFSPRERRLLPFN
jgi:hypothetical protein